MRRVFEHIGFNLVDDVERPWHHSVRYRLTRWVWKWQERRHEPVTELEVRPARPGDGHGVARAWIDAGRYYAEIAPHLFQVPAETGLAQWFDQDYANQAPGKLRLVATVDADVAGFVSATLQPPVPNPERQLIRRLDRPSVVVTALAVADRHRRTGIGATLMNHVERWALDNDADTVSLDTYTNSQLSVPFYETTMGYTRHALIFRKQLR